MFLETLKPLFTPNHQLCEGEEHSYALNSIAVRSAPVMHASTLNVVLYSLSIHVQSSLVCAIQLVLFYLF